MRWWRWSYRQGWTGRRARINLRSEDKVNLTFDHVISYSLLMYVNCHYGYTVYCAHAYQTYVLWYCVTLHYSFFPRTLVMSIPVLHLFYWGRLLYYSNISTSPAPAAPPAVGVFYFLLILFQSLHCFNCFFYITFFTFTLEAAISVYMLVQCH